MTLNQHDPDGPGAGTGNPVRKRNGIRIGVLALLVALQAACAVFFVGDVAYELSEAGLDGHTSLEAVATMALLLGVALGAVEIRRTIRQGLRSEAALAQARGAFAGLLDDRFDTWGLTPAEADVAMLTLKGFDGPEIAQIRGTAPGTVRAQLGRIYAKSGSGSRGQFVSLFIDALLDAPAAPPDSS